MSRRGNEGLRPEVTGCLSLLGAGSLAVLLTLQSTGISPQFLFEPSFWSTAVKEDLATVERKLKAREGVKQLITDAGFRINPEALEELGSIPADQISEETQNGVNYRYWLRIKRGRDEYSTIRFDTDTINGIQRLVFRMYPAYLADQGEGFGFLDDEAVGTDSPNHTARFARTLVPGKQWDILPGADVLKYYTGYGFNSEKGRRNAEVVYSSHREVAILADYYR